VYGTVFKDQEAIGSTVARLGFSSFDYLGGLLLYFSRLIYDSLSIALVPILSTGERNVFWVGLAYWTFGLLVLSSLISCPWTWVAGGEAGNLKLAASMVISVWLLVSLSLYVQSSYLMPMLPVAFGVSATLSAKVWFWIFGAVVGLSLGAVLVRGLIGRTLPLATHEATSSSVYILNKSNEGGY
jgi:hypothetical protein